MSTVGSDLDLALELAACADAITLARFGALDLRVAHKPDLTPVTDADEAVEAALREVLARERPGDDVFGEEQGGTVRMSGRQWVIDPIDGTKNFVRGVPVWASLIALLQDGVPVVGMVSAPALNRRWWAGRGLGAHTSFADGTPRPIAVSGVADLSAASLSFSDLTGWAERGSREQFLALVAQPCNLGDGQIGVPQQFMGLVHADVELVLVRCRAGMFLEHGPEPGVA